MSHSERTKNRAFLIACLRSDEHNAQKMVVLDSFQSARTDRKAAPRPTVRAALLVAPLLLLDFRGFAPNNTTKNQNFYLHAIRKRRLGKAPPFVGRFLIGFGRSERKYAFSAPGTTKKSSFSKFFKLFAPRLLLMLNRTVESMQNMSL